MHKIGEATVQMLGMNFNKRGDKCANHGPEIMQGQLVTHLPGFALTEQNNNNINLTVDYIRQVLNKENLPVRS